MNKSKPCNGIGKAKGYNGCGGDTLVRTYGLCSPCYRNWLLNTPEGNEHIKKVSIKSKKLVAKKKRIETKEKKVQLMSVDAYRKKFIQPKINKIIRLIDYGQPCIATGAYQGQMHAGHYISTGSNRTLTYNAHNIHIQSAHSNSWQAGDDKRYRKGLIDTYGVEYLEFVERLQRCKPINLNKAFLETLNIKLIQYTKQLEKVRRTPLGRLKLRNELNSLCGIYGNEFSEYNKISE